MNERTNFVARGLVRNFTSTLVNGQGQDGEINPPRQLLEGALVEEVECEDDLRALIRRATSGPRGSAIIDDQLAKLKSAVDAFNVAFPQIADGSRVSDSFSWKSLSHTLLRLKSQHEAKHENSFRGKSKKRFHNICGTINDHMGVMKIFPHGDKYVAPICGSVELIVKASVNHEHIGEEFGVALKEIDLIVRSVEKELSRSQDPDVIGWSIELCCYIVEFLVFPFEWYTQKSGKKLIKSLNENLAEKYREPIKRIRRLSKHIKRSFDLENAERVQNIEKLLPAMAVHFQQGQLHFQKYVPWVEEHAAKYEKALEDHRRGIREDQEYVLQKWSQLLQNTTGVLIRPLADREADIFVSNIQQAGRQPAGQRDIIPEGKRALMPSESLQLFERQQSSEQAFNTRSEVVLASAALDAYYDLEQIKIDLPVENMFVEGEAARRLQDWTAKPSSAMLGIFGPATAPHQDPTQMLMSKYIETAAAAGLLCISYFCSVTHIAPPGNRTRETVGLVQLMYALIKQLTGFLPAELSSSKALSRNCFDTLDGTLRTWPAALSLFKGLIEQAGTPYLLFAIHGIEKLEDSSTMPRLQSLLATLQDTVDSESSGGPRVKVVFASNGRSQVLSEGLRDEEICDVSQGNAARRPGRSGKGRRRFADLNLGEE